MTERIVNSTWWMVVMTMICATGAVALIVGYRGLFEVLAGRVQPGTACLGISLICGVGTWTLCKHRNDLL
jgi:hypothetical protein